MRETLLIIGYKIDTNYELNQKGLYEMHLCLKSNKVLENKLIRDKEITNLLCKFEENGYMEIDGDDCIIKQKLDLADLTRIKSTEN